MKKRLGRSIFIFALTLLSPAWLCGEEFVFRNTLSDADWTVLERAEGPVSVRAALTDVDDEDMKRFATLRTLEELDVSYCGITETGLEALKTLPNLKTLQKQNLWRLKIQFHERR